MADTPAPDGSRTPGSTANPQRSGQADPPRYYNSVDGPSSTAQSRGRQYPASFYNPVLDSPQYYNPPSRSNTPQAPHPRPNLAMDPATSYNMYGEHGVDPFRAIPSATLAAHVNPTPVRPRARPTCASSPATLMSHRDPHSPRYDPAYADALEAAAQSSIPVDGNFEQTWRETRTTEDLINQHSRQPPKNLQPPYASAVQLSAIAKGRPVFQHQPFRRSPLSLDANEEPDADSRVGDKRKIQCMAQEPASSPTPASTIANAATSAPTPHSPILTFPPRQMGETDAQWKTRRNRERKQVERSQKERAATEEVVEIEANPSVPQKGNKSARKNARAPKEGSVKPSAKKASAKKKDTKRKDAKPRGPAWENDRGNNGPDGASSLDNLGSWMGEEGVITTFKIRDLPTRRVMCQPFIKEQARQGMYPRDADAVIAKFKDVYQRVSKVADEIRNGSGGGVDVGEMSENGGPASQDPSSSAQNSIAKTLNGRLYLQLESVITNRHGINPLVLTHSSETKSCDERAALLDLLKTNELSAAEDSDSSDDAEGESTLSDTEHDDEDTGATDSTSKKGKTRAYAIRLPAKDGSEDGSSSTNRSLKKTGPAMRKSSAVPTSADGPVTTSEKKPKVKDDIGSAMTASMNAQLEMTKERGAKQDERMKERQKLDHERIELERAKAAREEQAHRQEMRMREQNHQLALSERFAVLMRRGLDPDAVGRVTFGQEVWTELRPVMMAFVAANEENDLP